MTIYYTTDESDPKTNGIGYTVPVYISQDTIIKAVSKSSGNQYSEITALDLKINPSGSPRFMIQYYEDENLNTPLPDPACVKAGTYYLKIVSNLKFSSGPFIDIDAEGTTNDVSPVAIMCSCIPE